CPSPLPMNIRGLHPSPLPSPDRPWWRILCLPASYLTGRPWPSRLGSLAHKHVMMAAAYLAACPACIPECLAASLRERGSSTEIFSSALIVLKQGAQA